MDKIRQYEGSRKNTIQIGEYINYFDIQVLMKVTETETLTSTLHHNIFTYLDYVFNGMM